MRRMPRTTGTSKPAAIRLASACHRRGRRRPCKATILRLYPGEVGYRQNTGTYDTQTFNSTIDKLNFKRQLSASSFGEIRVFRTSENLIFRYPYDVGSFSDFYEDLQTTNLGEAFDYTNQVSSKHELSFGSDVEYFKNRYSILSPSFENTYEPLEDLGCAQIGNAITNGLIPAANETSAYISNAFIGGCYIAPFNNALNLAFPGLGLPTDPAHAPLSTYVSNAGYSNDPLHRYDVYVKDQFQPSERMTITFGLRYDKESLPLPANAAQLNTTYFIDDSLPVGCSTVAAPPPPAAPSVHACYRARPTHRKRRDSAVPTQPATGVQLRTRCARRHAILLRKKHRVCSHVGH